MLLFLNQSPFVIPLLAAVVARLCAIFIRRSATILEVNFWWAGNLFSILSAGFLMVSFYLAIALGGVNPFGVGPTAILGNLAVIGGVLLVMWALMGIRLGAFLSARDSRLVTEGPYARLRRPIDIGVLMIAFGTAVSQSNTESWIWFGLWLPFSFTLSELEEWELRQRDPKADTYFKRTPRYFPWQISPRE